MHLYVDKNVFTFRGGGAPRKDSEGDSLLVNTVSGWRPNNFSVQGSGTRYISCTL